MSDTCQYLPRDEQAKAFNHDCMSDGDRRAWNDRHRCHRVAAWGIGDPAGEFSRSCAEHLAALANAECIGHPAMVWPLWMSEPRHPLQDDIDATRRDRDTADACRKDVVRQRDRLADAVRASVWALGAEFPPSDIEGCAASVKSMGQTILKYRQIERAQDDHTRQVDVFRLGLPHWFDGPLHYWRQRIFQETGQNDGIMSIVVSRQLGRALGLSRDECTVYEGAVRISVEQPPSGPELCRAINRAEIGASEPVVRITNVRLEPQDPDRWIMDLDDAAKRAIDSGALAKAKKALKL